MPIKSVFVLHLFLLAALGKTIAQGTISGRLSDSATKQQLSLATITVFKAKDTAIITYRLSDGTGSFKVPGIPFDILSRAVITFSGYRTFRKEFTLTAEQKTLDLGEIKLVNDPSALDEVIVTAERPPVSIKKDTIEFNASAFKTLPTALVEDLLKKLPGVDVDKEGNITVNGRKANRILVDGKEFFGGDPKVATRNLPADIIDKVQVSDDKEQLNANPDIAKADLGQVINLKLKKSIKQGMFGKVYAGAGTDDRYEVGGIANLFRDTFQISLLGYTNNLNKAGFGFGDIQNMGGFQRSGVNSIMINSEGGFAFNDISFGGTGQGIQRSTGGGFNANQQIGKKLTLNLQYFYGHINSRVGTISNIQQFFNDTALTTRSTTSQISDDYNHRIGGKIRYKIDSTSDFTFTPSFVIRKNLIDRDLVTESFNNFQPKLSQSNNLQNTESNSLGYSHDIYYNKTFRKQGRTLNVTNYLNTNSVDNDQVNDVDNIFFQPQEYYTMLDQLRDRDQNTFRTSLNINYSEPITKALSLRASNNTDYFSDNDNINTFNRPLSGGKYDSLNNLLSNGFKRSGFRNNAALGIRWKVGKVSFSPAINLQTININNRFVKNAPIDQNFNFILPSLGIQWSVFNFNYRVYAQEPNVNDLQPVQDNTNPLYIQLGNPSLIPAISHSLSLNFYKYDQKRMLSYNAYANGSISDNAVIRERTVDPTGVQISSPLNVDGIWSFYGNGNVRKQIKLINSWQMSFSAGFNANYNKSVIIVNKLRSGQENISLSPSASIAFNYKDLFEINQRYAPTWSRSRYDNPIYPGLEVIRHTSSSEVVVRLPKHWVWESTIDYWYNPQVAPGIRKTNFRWNAAVNFLFLKDDKGQLKLSVYDLLNQNISVSRTVRENYIQDFQSVILQRYFMLTFTYNIRNFAGGKVGGRQSIFMF